MRRVLGTLLVGMATALAVVSCGDEPAPAADTTPSTTVLATPLAPPRYAADATVLEDETHGPQLCLGVIADSYPPQCGGPDLVGWSWDDVPWRESGGRTTWAAVSVVGTWDGAALTLTEAPARSTGSSGVFADPEPDFTAPCPPPDGGWAVRDPNRISMADQQTMWDYANAQPDLAASWVDQSVNPAYPGPGPMSTDVAARLNDPAQMIVVVAFTGDLDRHRAELEARWGGMLCVTQLEHTRAELQDLQRRVSLDPDLGFIGSNSDELRGRVVLYVTVADDRVVTLVGERYGDLVDVYGALRPVG